MKYNPERKIVCCLWCGRDTRNVGGYCSECAPKNYPSKPEEPPVNIPQVPFMSYQSLDDDELRIEVY